VGREGCLREVLLELLGGKVGEENAAHAGAVGRETATDVEIDGHDAADLGASDVDDVFAVECGDGEGFVQGCGHALEDGLSRGSECIRRGVGVGEGEHARAKGVAGPIFCAGEAEFGEGVEAAADGGAGETGFDAELRDRHLRGLLSKGLDDDEAAGERGHEVGVAGKDVKGSGRAGLGSCRDGWREWWNRWEGLAGGEAHAGPFRALSSRNVR